MEPNSHPSQGLLRTYISQQQTTVQPVVASRIPTTPLPLHPLTEPDPTITPLTEDTAISSTIPTAPATKRRQLARMLALVLTAGLALALYLIWRPPQEAPSTNKELSFQPSYNNLAATSESTDEIVKTLQIYVVGAVKRPGVYRLPGNARVHQALKAAGGPLPEANLVAINLAAPLSDGQQIYVTKVGEIPPSYVGGIPAPGPNGATATSSLTNINTATSEQLRYNLHVSSATADAIVTYRQQHGNYTSVDQLLKVVTKTIYAKIKDLVTV